MIPLSSAVTLAWQIAALEAAHVGQQFIEKEQVFIGLLKIGDLLELESHGTMAQGMPRHELELLEKELSPLEELLSEFKLNKVEVRRLVRGLVGKGDYIHKGSVIHRSERCKFYFKRAGEIAHMRQALSMRPHHLFEAILEDAGQLITQAFLKFGLETEVLYKAASKVEGKETVGAFAQRREATNDSLRGKTSLLEKFGVDLTYLAKEGKIEPLIGRREELLKVIRTLSRKTKNSPILIGDAGVGKTAIIRGLALRIAQGNITPLLQDKRIIELSMAELVAGTKYRGEFEERIIKTLEEAKKDEHLLLFIDEIHTSVGAGRAEGAIDVANIMKPILSSGEIRCIGATTLTEYRKYREKDPALERRFQPIMIKEASEEETLQILKELKERYEGHHQVVITKEGLNAAVKLSVRYLPDRHLPDKALDLVDEACSRVKVSSLSFLGKVEKLCAKTVQVTEEVVAKVVADWTGQPVGKPGPGEQKRLSQMEDVLKKRVIGQDEAIERVAKIIRMGMAGLREPKRPRGVFLFVGPTGVGKTELAKSMAEFLFGSEDQMIRLDMSEYMEKHSFAKLIGAPPGYIGYGEEGQLTGRLKTYPYTVVLLDEIEKAHPEILDIFLQLFDEARITDAKGRRVDAKNIVFVMTSNIGGEYYQKEALGFNKKGVKERDQEVRAQLKRRLRPEFLNRIDEIIIFRSLEVKDIARIVSLMLSRVKGRLKEQGIMMEDSEKAVNFLAEQGYDAQYGARPVSRTIDRLINEPLANNILKGEFKAGDKLLISVIDKKIQFKIKGGNKI